MLLNTFENIFLHKFYCLFAKILILKKHKKETVIS